MPVKLLESPRFEVLRDPFIPLITAGGKSTIAQLDSKKALQALHAAQRKGCYIFAVKSYGKVTPWYVGKATKGFGQEVFTDRNCKIYAEALDSLGKGTPTLYFIALPDGAKGAVNRRAIDKLEDLLIRDCGGQNSELLNKRKITIYKNVIAGVMNCGSGKPSDAAKAIRAMTGRN